MESQDMVHPSFASKREFEKVITTIREKSDGLRELLLLLETAMEYEDCHYSNALFQMECIAADLCEEVKVLQKYLYPEE